MKSMPVPTRELMTTARRLLPEPDGAKQSRDVTELQPDVAHAMSPAITVGVHRLEPKLCPETVSVVSIATAGQLKGVKWETTGAAHDRGERLERLRSQLEKLRACTRHQPKHNRHTIEAECSERRPDLQTHDHNTPACPAGVRYHSACDRRRRRPGRAAACDRRGK